MAQLRSRFGTSLAVFVLVVIAPSFVAAQTTTGAAPTSQQTQASATTTRQPPAAQLPAKPSLEREFLKNILRDQRAIWTWPLHFHGEHGWWLASLGVATTALFMTDEHTAARLGDNQTRLSLSRNISKIGVGYVGGGLAGAFYIIGRAAGIEKARETGLLMGEALVDAIIVYEPLKAVTQRKRPVEQPGEAHFFNGGNAFPSGHSTTAWSLATVVAHEYSNLPVQITAYGLASLVSISRFTGRKHFLSDVLVGSAIGYGIGRYVYRAHHDPALDASAMQARQRKLKLLPAIAPVYNRANREYGISLAWGL